MILILIALVSLTAIAAYCAQKDVWCSGFHEVFCPIFVCLGFIGLIIYSFVCFEYTAAGYKKDIINREYKTDYTQNEVFYASDVINTIRELDRKRIEINGDIMRDKK